MSLGLAAIATQGHFGDVVDRIVSIATQGHYDMFAMREVLSLAGDIKKRSGGIEIDKRSGGITIDS